jgi:hypothetical protein
MISLLKICHKDLLCTLRFETMVNLCASLDQIHTGTQEEIVYIAEERQEFVNGKI